MTCAACGREIDRPVHVIERGVPIDDVPTPRDLPYCSDHFLAAQHGHTQETP